MPAELWVLLRVARVSSGLSLLLGVAAHRAAAALGLVRAGAGGGLVVPIVLGVDDHDPACFPKPPGSKRYRQRLAGRAKRLPPRLDRLPPAGLPAPSEPEVAGGAAGWEHVRISGAVRAVPGVRRYRFERCELRGVTLPESCRELQVADCMVTTLDVANASLQSFEASGTSFTSCRFLGATIAGTIDRSVFTDCQLTMASLRMCRLSDVDFRGCAMREVDFYGAALRSVLFQSCDLTAATLSRASLAGCAMRDCRLDDLRGVEALGGVGIPYADLISLLPELARAAGIEIEVDGHDGTVSPSTSP